MSEIVAINQSADRPAEPDDEFDDEPADPDDLDDWALARNSADMADALIDMIDDKVFEITGGNGQQKVIWARVIAELHAAYYEKFLECL